MAEIVDEEDAEVVQEPVQEPAHEEAIDGLLGRLGV
jgi:hypothetical protein